MNIIRQILAAVIGLVFLFSSVLKLLDPVGTGLIVESYFRFLNISFLMPSAKFLGMALSLIEGMTAITLLSGVWRKIAAIATFSLLGFFTIISILLVVFNPDMNCGCFGQFIELTHIQTLIKNVVLLVFACAAFIPLKIPAGASSKRYTAFAVGSAILLVFTIISALNIPIVDFSEFKPSHTIVLEGEIHEDANEYPTLTLYDENGLDRSDEILVGKVVLLSVYNPQKLDEKQRKRLCVFAQQAFDSGFRPICVSAGSVDIPGVENFTADYKKLITLNRSNGGLVFLDDGFIMRKRSARLLLSPEKIKKLADEDSTEIYVQVAIQRSMIFQLSLFALIALLLLL